MNKHKQVQIDQELFFELVKYHCLEIYDNEDYIKKALAAKIDKMAARQQYTNRIIENDKTAP